MPLPKNDIKSIAIFRALQLGDLLCSIPACRALRASFPEAHISLVGLPWMKMLIERFPAYFDEFIWFPGYPGLPEQPILPDQTAAFIAAMVSRKFDLVLQMQGNGSIVNPLIELFGARYTAGFCCNGHYCPNQDYFLCYPEGVSEIRRHLALMEKLGVPSLGDHLEFPVTEKDESDLKRSVPGIQLGNYVCVHPGSRGAWRQWPAHHFAEMAGICAGMGMQVVLTGTADEMPIVSKVAQHMQTQPLIAAGKTDIGALAAVLKNANGLISNCTGVSHLAAAMRTPSVVISMDGEPERWAPTNGILHTTIDWTRDQDINAVRLAVETQFLTAS